LNPARLAWSAGALLAKDRRVRGERHVTPFAISFLVTNRCSLSCKHCFYHAELAKPPDGELGLDEYETLTRRMGPFGIGLFCGGEPYMRRDLAEIVNLFRTHNDVPLAGVATNGQNTASIVRQTRAILEHDRHKSFNVAFSIDGFRDTHDAIRGAGSFDRSLRSYREAVALRRHYPNLILTTTLVLNRMNEGEAEAFARHVRETLQPDAVHVLVCRQSPRDGEHMKGVRPETYLRVQEEALRAVRSRSLLGRFSPEALLLSSMRDLVHRTMVTGERSFSCRAGKDGALVDYKGDVHVCEVLAEDPGARRIGNLRDYDLDFVSLWNSGAADAMRALVNRHPSCASCTHETVGLMPSIAFGDNPLRALRARIAKPRPIPSPETKRRLPLVHSPRESLA
jgi:MoaA/NifB/PqqE/SkfB family radical SAM enzyme